MKYAMENLTNSAMKKNNYSLLVSTIHNHSNNSNNKNKEKVLFNENNEDKNKPAIQYTSPACKYASKTIVETGNNINSTDNTLFT
jgi:hypothetical protein